MERAGSAIFLSSLCRSTMHGSDSSTNASPSDTSVAKTKFSKIESRKLDASTLEGGNSVVGIAKARKPNLHCESSKNQIQKTDARCQKTEPEAWSLETEDRSLRTEAEKPKLEN